MTARLRFKFHGKQNRVPALVFLPFLLLTLLCFPNMSCARKWDALSKEEQATLHQILNRWKSWVPEQKKAGTAPLMTFEELYQGMSPEERDFLDRIRAINPRKKFGFQGSYLGISNQPVRFKRIDNEWITKEGKSQKLEPQYLPEKVDTAYEAMMAAMKHSLGKRLFVDSGYRSPACQLYTFLFYLPKHHYSLVETGHWIALPGYSEHGDPSRQAIDFINEEGINGEDDAESFERLSEYRWLVENAGKFGFELSYPRGKKGITFEPWHWRYVNGNR